MSMGPRQLKPLQARARNMLGYALYRLARYSAAIEVFDMALEDAGDNAERRGQILGDRSLSLAALGHHDEAIAEAGRALELAPSQRHAEPHAGLRPLFQPAVRATPSR